MARKPQLVEVLAGDKVIKKKGHFAPGTVPARAEHAVPRRLALSLWLNPDKETPLDQGLSASSLKALTQDNELQGPTNWSSVDLRLKYRDERQRTKAWQSSLEREREAERLRVEDQVFVSVVTVSRHPVHVDFWQWLEEENRNAANKARARNKLKTFSYDMPVIWNANRETASETIQVKSVQGIDHRRDLAAHESRDCQVQSVTPQRAMLGIVKGSEKGRSVQEQDDISAAIRSKIHRVSQARLSIRQEDDAAFFLSKLTSKTPFKMGTAPEMRVLLTVRADGLLGAQVPPSEPAEGTAESSESILVSVYKRQESESFAIYGYSFLDSTEYHADISRLALEAMIRSKQEHQQREREQHKEMQRRKLEKEQANQQAHVERAKNEDAAVWWYAATLAAQVAHYKVDRDHYAELVGYAPEAARAAATLVSRLEQAHMLDAKLACAVHRQAVRVRPSFEPCSVTVGVAAVSDEDPDRTAIVIHVQWMNTAEATAARSTALCFSVSALRRWMQDQGVLEQVDLPPTQLKWWLLSSDWKTTVFRTLFGFLCVEQGRPRVPGLELAQGAVRFQYIRTLLNHVKETRAQSVSVEDACIHGKETTLLDRELALRQVLLSEKRNGGLGIVEQMWAMRRTMLRKQGSMAIRNVALTRDDEVDLPLALQFCGKEREIGCPPPSTTLHGRNGPTPTVFVRDAAISSTNSVTCVLNYALDSPLLVPTLLGFHAESLLPAKKDEHLDVPAAPTLAVAPFVVKNVISKLDFRESCTIMTLNASAEELDLGMDQTGHRRLDPEMTSFSFRSWVLALREELCFPDGVVCGTVFGITQQSATTNAPDTWPHRYTWHSDEMTDQELTRKRIAQDFAYVSRRGASVGSNDPNTYKNVLEVETCTKLLRRSRTDKVSEQREFEERVTHEEADRILNERLDEAKKSKAQAEETRALLEQQLNDKKLARERQLRGKAKASGAKNEDWEKRVCDPKTRKLGRWKKWQAYLYLDEQVKEIVRKAARQSDLDQLARIAAGQRPKTKKVITEEAFSLAVKEGTLFYHHEIDDAYQWDQPEGWEGVATVAEPFEQDPNDEIREAQAQAHPLRGDELGLDESAVKLGGEYDSKTLQSQSKEELKAMRMRDAAKALDAARAVEQARRLRFIEQNVRNWLDQKAGALGERGAFDLRLPFRDMDEDRTGVVSYEQFKLGVANLELELPLEDQDTLIKHFDKAGDGVVDYIEFVFWAIYTRPQSMLEWMERSMDHPELGPNTWAAMRQKDKLLRTIALHEEYKETLSGQHYFFDMQSGLFAWVMPETVAVKAQQERDAYELRQAQVAASMAAKAAAESAEQAERASEKSMERLVEELATSSDFVQMVAESLGLDQSQLRERLKQQQQALNLPDVPKLELESGTDDDNNDDFDAEDSDDDQGPITGPTNIEDAIQNPGVEWRILKPGHLKEGFITKASKPNTRGADELMFTGNLNRPSIVGVVDPADVSHIPFEDFPPVETKFVGDVMEDTMRASNMSKDQLLDKSDEEQMLEMIQDAFLAVRNLNMSKLEELIDLGVQVSEVDENGNTLFLIAAQQGSKKLAKFLLRRGAEINAKNLHGNTALHFCFQYSFKDLAEYLIGKGADDSILNKDGLTCYEGLNADIVDKI